jgi:pyruvate dehydrogenase E1 component
VIAKAKSGPKKNAVSRPRENPESEDRAKASHNGEDTRKWLDAMEFVIEYALRNQGSGRAPYFVDNLVDRLRQAGIKVPPTTNTPYVNTIPVEKEPPYPGDWQIETRIKSFIRWNAMAMVVNANRKHSGLGGHISTYASSATLYEVAYNHFFRGDDDGGPADIIYFQGHATPGNYARAYLERRLDDRHLHNFRQELAEGGGLSSYPHPYLMPDFWQFPTVSMGLGPINSIYQARFNRYLQARNLVEWKREPKVWCFVGDGECDEPESLGELTLPARENLDNLVWVINCNLQRLDGPVRGNGKIIQELEGVFRGAG